MISWIIFISIQLLAIAFILRLNLFKSSGIKAAVRIALYVLKLSCGILLTLIYTYYYTDRTTADIYKYFDDALVLDQVRHESLQDYGKILFGIDEHSPSLQIHFEKTHNWKQHSEQWLEFTQTENYNFLNSNRLITRMHMVLLPISLGNIYTHVSIFAFFSLIGLFVLFKQVKTLRPDWELTFFILIFFSPSLLLWCSAPLKDTVVLFALNIGFYALYRFSKKEKTIQCVVIFSTAILLLLWSKYYVAAAFLAVVPGYLIAQLNGFSRMRVQFIALIVLFISILIIGFLYPTVDIPTLISGKREEALKTAIWAEASHLLFLHRIEPTWTALFLEAPSALFNAFFRPHLAESSGSIFIMLSALENTFFFCLIIVFLIRIDWKNKSPQEAISFLLYAILLALIIGITTPVTGGIVRYKTAFILYFVIGIILYSKPWKTQAVLIKKVKAWLFV